MLSYVSVPLMMRRTSFSLVCMFIRAFLSVARDDVGECLLVPFVVHYNIGGV